MSFGAVDFVVAGWVLYGAWRGRQRGLPWELPLALQWLVVLVTGAGCLHWTQAGLAQISQYWPAGSGLGGMVVAFVLVRLLRGRLRRWLEGRVSEWDPRRWWSAVAGMVRVGLASATLLVVVAHLPLGMGQGFCDSSLVGRAVTGLLPER